MAQRKPHVSPEIAMASDIFDKFCAATTLKTILFNYRQLCNLLHLKPNNFPHFYPKLKSMLVSWRAQALWNKFDKRASHKCYNRGNACPDTRVLIIGAGPCGLRAAIEAQLLGAKVVVIDKRDRMTRNNVLHLWPFVIQDLRALGAKKFYGKFCAGSIDHISIRQLQCILMKVALLLGVEIHEGVSFTSLLPPENQQESKIGWRAKVSPIDHPVSQYEFDVLIGADGKRNTLEGFKRKEFRGKLAIAITANFINHHSEAEARVEEISGVAFIFKQKFFKDLYSTTGIDLENIVYYKDETHYFVMTAKKHSLLNKGVIINDYSDTAKLLALENVHKEALMDYAKEAADFSTNYKLPELQFAVNHYGQPDIAMFDFTSMYAAENASRVIQQDGHKLFVSLVGDSLLEPFWPTGSGCARGFLSSMDTCWAIRSWGSRQRNPLEILAERESTYRLLAQTTPENLQRDTSNYTLDPHTRYPNLNSRAVLPIQVTGLYTTDDQSAVDLYLKSPSANIQDFPKRKRKKESVIYKDALLSWLKRQVALYDNVVIEDTNSSFKNGLALCAIIHRYRSDLIDFHSLQPDNVAENNQLAFDILEKEYGILPVMTGTEMLECEVPDNLAMLSYLSQVYDTFRGEIPYVVNNTRLDEEELNQLSTGVDRNSNLAKLITLQKISLLNRLSSTLSRKRHRESHQGRQSSHSHAHESLVSRKCRKRKSITPSGTVERRKLELEKIREKALRDICENPKNIQQVDGDILKHVENIIRQNGTNSHLLGSNDGLVSCGQQTPQFKQRVKDLERKLLYPDRTTKELKEIRRSPLEDDFSGRVKDIEDKLLRGSVKSEKKPKDLLRAIGKIEKTDWNVKEIEKKIEENKYGKGTKSKVEKVPKWSRQQFHDKFSAVKQKLQDDVTDEKPQSKYAEIDENLKKLDEKLKNGGILSQGERGANKVSAMAAHLATMHQPVEYVPPMAKVGNRAAVNIMASSGSETCHFCNKRVYLMERLSTEGRFFHRGCFRCEYCLNSLRLGNYSFDRDGKYGSRFYCVQHFGLPGTLRTKIRNHRERILTKDITKDSNLPSCTSMITSTNDDTDTYDRRVTQERIGFENLDLEKDETGETTRSEMDEDEWTDHNFGTSANELASSDDLSDLSDFGDNGNEYDEGQPNGERRLEDAHKVTKSSASNSDLNTAIKYSILKGNGNDTNDNVIDEEVYGIQDNKKDTDLSSSDESQDCFSCKESDVTDSDCEKAPIDEDEKLAREMRMQEVRIQVPERIELSDSGSNTEVPSEFESESEYTLSSNSDESSDDDSATEISTDSEFERNDRTVIRREIPNIIVSESIPVRKGYLEEVRKVQLVNEHLNALQRDKYESGINKKGSINKIGRENISKKNEYSPNNNNNNNNNNNASNNNCYYYNKGDYGLNRTQSTEGVASKISLELKKKYLLGNASDTNLIRKSESSTVLGTKFKSFMDQISEQQKLLNPAPEPSLTMQAFLETTEKLRRSPTLSPSSSFVFKKSKDLLGINDFQHICNKSDNTTTITDSNLTNTSSISNSTIVSQIKPIISDRKSYDTFLEISKNVNEEGETSETSILVPNMPKNDLKTQINDSDSYTSEISCTDEEENNNDKNNVIISLPKFEIHNSHGELVISGLNNELELSNDVKMQTIENDTFPVLINANDNYSILNTDILITSTSSNDDTATTTTKDSTDDSSTIIKMTITPDLFENNVNENEQDDPTNQISNDLLLMNNDEIHSDKSSPNSPISIQADESTLTMFTEMELSDWARDDDVTQSENIDDAIVVIDTRNITYRKHQKPRGNTKHVCKIKLINNNNENNNFEHVCEKSKYNTEIHPTFALNNIEGIEYMDTEEDFDELLEDGDCKSSTNNVIENRGYTEYVTSDDDPRTPVPNNENENDNDNANDNISSGLLLQTKSEPCEVKKEENYDQNKINPNSVMAPNNNNDIPHKEDYEKFVQRIQNRISPFSNAKDSIDVRKSRKATKSSPETSPIAIESKSIFTPTSWKLEQLSRERNKQKDIVHDMVMNKLHAEGRLSCERKSKRSYKTSLSPNNLQCRNVVTNKEEASEKFKELKNDDVDAKSTATVGSKLSVNVPKNLPVDNLGSGNNPTTPTSKKDSIITSIFRNERKSNSFSLPDINKAIQDTGNALLTPLVPPSPTREKILQSTEYVRETARARARLMSDSELGLSPEEKLRLLKSRIAARKGIKSAYGYGSPENEHIPTKADELFSDIEKNYQDTNEQFQDDNKSTSPACNKSWKDKERRRSIIQAVSDFFHKKSSPKMDKMTTTTSVKPTTSSSIISSNKLAKLRSNFKSKDKTKSLDDLLTAFSEENYGKVQSNFYTNCDNDIDTNNHTTPPPPRPPSPFNYAPTSSKSGENSINVINESTSLASLEEEVSGTSSSRQNGKNRRLVKQVQQKKLRMAQEIQRQLEEIEVQQKELEIRGVNVEKALRGEDDENQKDEPQLLQELLDLMRERNTLRKYERKLISWAQEIEENNEDENVN